MRNLPTILSNPNQNSSYKLSDFIDKTTDYIINSRTGYIYIDNFELLKNNLDFLVWILDTKKINRVSCPNYDIIKYIDENVFDRNIKCNLLDDGKNIDRSYINLEEIENVNCIIPLVYLLWDVKFYDKVNVSVLQYSDVNCSFSVNGNKQFDIEHLKKIKDLINKLNEIKCNNDIEKTIVVSNYIQKNIQYIDEVKTPTHEGVYIVNPNNTNINHEKSSLVETILDEHYGICMSIANTTTMLLNNPIFNVDIRSIFGSGHVWNIIKIEDNSYYIDNTWSITRNKDRVYHALKAHGFTDEYLFFGELFAKTTGHHDAKSSFFDYNLDKNNLDKKEVLRSKKVLEKSLNYNYGPYVPFNSIKR